MVDRKIVALLILAIVGSSLGYYVGDYRGYANGYLTGNNTGYSTGYNDGKEDGYTEGENAGYQTGFSNGTKIGYNNGYNSGQSIGYTNGFSAGNTAGYNYGYNLGNSVGYTRGKGDGYKIGFDNGFNTTGYSIRDPTYQEVTNFLRTDKTESLTYSDSFTCENFASTLKQNAFKAGYRCFYVVIDFYPTTHSDNPLVIIFSPVAYGHACNAFNTSDKGMVYIEPQGDNIMHVAVDQPYWDRTVFGVPSYNDTVKQYMVIP